MEKDEELKSQKEQLTQKDKELRSLIEQRFLHGLQKAKDNQGSDPETKTCTTYWLKEATYDWTKWKIVLRHSAMRIIEE